MFKCFCSILLLGLLPLGAYSQSSLYERVQDYVDEYKDIAIEEMEKSGIPASIKLAQAIQESAFGTSELAENARNHFGIKCADWTGSTYYKQDDEAHKSCFRVYDNAEQSFRDHTEFLTTRSHYSFLFDYESTDYKRWAKGLKKAGYATDPKYPSKIIKTIETYKLAQYDQPGAGEGEEVPIEPFQAGVELRKKTRSFLFRNYKKGIFNRNRAAFFVAQPSETALAAATRMGIPYHRFLKFNDLKDGDVLIEYQYCFIQPKKKSFNGKEDVHKVENDERMYEIAQFYGLALEKLYELNKLEEGQEPENGALIYLKSEAPNRPKLRPENHQDIMPLPIGGEENPVIEPQDTIETIGAAGTGENNTNNNSSSTRDTLALNTPTYPSNVYEGGYLNTGENAEAATQPPGWVEGEEGNMFPEPQDTSSNTEPPATVPSGEVSNTPSFPPITTEPSGGEETSTAPSPPTTEPSGGEEPTPPSTTPSTIVKEHIVQPGEGLWSIARKYDVSVSALRSYNNLTSDNLQPKQKLRIPPKGAPTTPSPSTEPTSSPAPTPSSPKTYTVETGDSLWSISNKLGVSVEALKKANSLSGNTIQVGMQLKVPQ